jgi:protein O-GlcNAc transferase
MSSRVARLTLMASLFASFAARPDGDPAAPGDREAAARSEASTRLAATNSTDAAGPPTSDAAQQDRELREEQLKAAQQLYQEFPRSDAAFVMGSVCHEQGDTEAAIRYWEEEIRLEADAGQLQDRAEAYSNLGEVWREKGEYDKAEAMLRESLRLNPRGGETQFRLAHVFYLQGRMEDCLALLDEGKVVSYQGYGLRGQVCQRLGRLDDARRNYELALRLNASFADAYYGLGMICARQGDEAGAAQYQQRFAALKTEHQVMGRRLRTEFNPLTTTRQSLAQTHTQVGWVYLTRGKPERAEKLWRRAAEVDPGNTACRFQLVMLCQKAGRNQEALQLCQEMIRAEPTNGFHYLGLGNLHARLNQHREAEAAYQRATELAPERAEGWFALAQFYLQANTNLTEAVRLSQRAVSLAPLAPHYYILSRACARNGDRAAARAAIERACELDPQNLQYRKLRESLASAK